MKARLLFSSTLILALLFTATFALLLMAVQGLDPNYRLPFAIGVALALNVTLWLISPFLMDLSLAWAYKSDEVAWADFRVERPELARFVERTCEARQIPLPRLRLIRDQNPTAFCYGSGRWNARLVVSDGLFTYLNEAEAEAVFAHELGHIHNNDFIVMTIISTLLAILYAIYLVGRSKGGRNDKNPLAAAALIAFVTYEIGVFLSLYLSRSREMLADRFAAEVTRDPNALTMALVKIAYGITRVKSMGESQDHGVLGMTRTLGIVDHKRVTATGTFFGAIEEKRKVAPLERLFLFDIFSPWARLSELGSTHPLTGRRASALSSYCGEFGKVPLVDLSPKHLAQVGVDEGRLYRGFVLQSLVYLSPYLFLILGLALPFLILDPRYAFACAPLGLGVGIILVALSQYPAHSAPEKLDVFDLMVDPYASPLRGRLVTLEGELIGRVDAGSKFGPDLVLADVQGRIALLYKPFWPFLRFFFGWRTVPRLLGQRAQGTGWFLRGSVPYVKLKSLEVGGPAPATYTCHPKVGSFLLGGVCVAFGLFVFALLAASGVG